MSKKTSSKNKKPTLRNKFIHLALWVGLVGIVGLVLFVLSIYLGFWGVIPSKQAVSEISNSQSTLVYDKNQEVLGKYYLFDRTSIKFDDLPKHLIKALIATEDARFFEHNGIDNRSLFRVLIKTIILGQRSAGGGSTISQQLAKNLYPRDNYSKFGLAISKVKESIIALRLEEVYSKEKILTLYLNTVSFPDNTFGIESASERFFSKHVSKLNVQEAALLIGSLKATYTYNPRLHPEKSKERRNTVLYQMVKYEYLPPGKYVVYKNDSIQLNYNGNPIYQSKAPYFVEEVRGQLKQLIKRKSKKEGGSYNIYTDGLKVYTTLDLEMQMHAERAVTTHLPVLQKAFEKNWGSSAPWRQRDFINQLTKQSLTYKKYQNEGLDHDNILVKMRENSQMELFSWTENNVVKSIDQIDSLLHYVKLLNAGFVAMDAKSGAINSWVGGIDFKYFKYDHVNQSKRQVGSTFKPFVYATAIENGHEPCDYVHGGTLTYSNYDDWTPSNGTDEYDEKYISLPYALKKSINTVAVKLMEEVGVSAVTNLVEDAGIDSELPQVPSLALGTASISVIELLQAYSIFLDKPSTVEPYLIQRIEDRSGNVLYEHEAVENDELISSYTQEVMLEMLQGVITDGGTGSRLRWEYNLTNDIAGKTGTTQSNRDGWFVGLTPDLITVSWVGADDSRVHFKDTQIGQGSNSALPIFGLFYKGLTQDAQFDTMTKNQFDTPSEGVKDDLDCPGIKEETFIQSIFDQDARVKERTYNEKDTVDIQKDGIINKLKGLFKKKK
ncbi:MAG: transglycosylase domain-containing protein [Reichenbachiella sp.]